MEDAAQQIRNRMRGARGNGRTFNLLGLMTIVVCMMAYIAHKTIPSIDKIPLVHEHLHDVMAMPILLGWIDLIVDHSSPKNTAIRTWHFAILLTVAGSIWWEILDPLVDDQSWSDPWDVVSYFIGMTAYCLARTSIKHRNKNRTSIQEKRA